jgi:hypothetical protein
MVQNVPPQTATYFREDDTTSAEQGSDLPRSLAAETFTDTTRAAVCNFNETAFALITSLNSKWRLWKRSKRFSYIFHIRVFPSFQFDALEHAIGTYLHSCRCNHLE